MARRREPQFGNVRQLPSGRWQARYTYNGAVHKAALPFDTKGDAQMWLASQRTDLARGTWKAASAPTIFGAHVDRWLADRDLKPRTHAHYKKIIDTHLRPTFGALPLDAITPETVRQWYAKTATTTPTTRAHAYGLLRTILNTAVADGKITANPCMIRGAGQAKRVKQIEPATLPQLERLVEAMPERYRLLVLLAAWCGLRFGELAELRRKDVDLATGVLHVRRGVVRLAGETIIGRPKSEAGVRDVAVPPHLMPAVRAHLDTIDHSASALLFTSSTGSQLVSSTLQASWWPARAKAGLPHLRFHDLRHTGAVLAASTGATLAELMARLGHSTPGAALRYQHAAKGRDAEIAAALSALVTQK